MKQIRVVYTDNSTGQFCCEDNSISYDSRAVAFTATTSEHIVIPYYNVYIIRELEDKKDGSVRSD